MSNQSRRKLFKSIAAGSGAIVAGKSLPESWSRPVVDSVMLPVHARTTGCGVTGITVSMYLVGIGDQLPVWGYTLYDATQCYFNGGGPSPTNQQWNYPQLGPGTYYFSGQGVWGGGADGEGRLAVSCCNALAEASASGIDQSFELTLEIVIDSEGGCSISQRDPQGLPPSPCT